MSLEGLKVVLEKEAVVGTPTAQRMLESPIEVERMYLRHVRSYVPLGRAVNGDNTGEGLSVSQYEKRLIRLVKESKAAKGYVTADFGYGKTSTCAFIWERCARANLLTVPPFQIEALDHLLTATYSWVKHCLAGSRPMLVERATEIYDKYRIASIERYAGGNPDVVRTLEAEQRAGRWRMELNATDYIHFFEEMTALAIEAGYEGLVVLVDEVQQYIDPAIKAGVRDPIAPLFDLVQALVTREGHLRFGIIFSIPKKELGVINDQRGDLIQRLKKDGLALDLGSIYNREFAAALWAQLAEQFDFQGEAPRVVDSKALDSLGEIASRQDISNGPRTVVNVFKLMAQRYLDSGGGVAPYSPLDLVDSFMKGQVSFDGMNKLQSVVNAACMNRIVKGNQEREQAVRLMAAYPTDGVTRDTLACYNLEEAADSIANMGQGDLVIFVGGGRDTQGREVPLGITLLGLEQAQVNVDWLQTTIREFHRGYYETSSIISEQAAKGFTSLLKERVFTPGWKVAEETEPRLTQPRGLLFEGSFTSTRKKYPDRRVYAVITVGDDARDMKFDVGLRNDGKGQTRDEAYADMVFNFVLESHLDAPEGERRQLPGNIEENPTGASFRLNLMHRDNEEIYRDLTSTLQPVVNPWKLTPMLMLSLYQYLDEKRAKGLVPKGDDDFVKNIFQPALLDHCTEELFNSEVGKSLGASGTRIVEDAFRNICERIMPQYNTLMVSDQWRSAIRDYSTALERLPSVYDKRGDQAYTETKDKIAAIFNRSNTALDNFIAGFGDLIEVVERWQTNRPGAVRFKLHPLERRIIAQLEAGTHHVKLMAGNREQTLRALPTNQVYAESRSLGYRDPEIETILELLKKRDLIIVDPRGVIALAPHTAPSRQEYSRALQLQQQRVTALLNLFQGDAQLQNWKQKLEQMAGELNDSKVTLDDQKLTSRTNTLASYEAYVTKFCESKRADLAQRVNDTLHNILPWDSSRYSGLDRAATGSFFADQLGQLRIELLKDRLALQDTAEKMRAALVDLAQELNTNDSSHTNIEKWFRRWEDTRKQYTKAQQDTQMFAALYVQYTEAAHLLEAATEMQTSALELGEPAKHLQEALNNLGTDIRGEFSSYKRKALERVPAWKERYAEVKRDLDRVRGQAIGNFNNSQEQLRQALIYRMGIPQEQLFEPIVYNPIDPQGSYAKLYESIKNAVYKLASRFTLRADTIESEVQQAQHSSSLESMLEEDKAELQQGFNEILAEIGEMRQAALKLYDLDLESVQSYAQAGMNDVEGDLIQAIALPSTNSFILLFEVVNICKRHLAGAVQRTQELTERMGRVALKPDEEELYRVILRLTNAPNADIDMGQIMSDPIVARGSEGFWQLLGALYDKRRIRVKVLTVEGD